MGDRSIERQRENRSQRKEQGQRKGRKSFTADKEIMFAEHYHMDPPITSGESALRAVAVTCGDESNLNVAFLIN